MALGQTVGHVSQTASCTMFLPEYLALITALAANSITQSTPLASVGAAGYMDSFFDIFLTYSLGQTIPGLSLMHTTLKGCRIKSDHQSHSQGSGDTLKVRFDLSPMAILQGFGPTGTGNIAPVADYFSLVAGGNNITIQGV